MERVPFNNHSEEADFSSVGPMSVGALWGMATNLVVFAVIGPQGLPTHIVMLVLLSFLFVARAAYLRGLRRIESADDLVETFHWIPRTSTERIFALSGALSVGSFLLLQFLANELAAQMILMTVSMLAIFLGLNATNRYQQIEVGLKTSASILFIAVLVYVATLLNISIR